MCCSCSEQGNSLPSRGCLHWASTFLPGRGEPWTGSVQVAWKGGGSSLRVAFANLPGAGSRGEIEGKIPVTVWTSRGSAHKLRHRHSGWVSGSPSWAAAFFSAATGLCSSSTDKQSALSARAEAVCLFVSKVKLAKSSTLRQPHKEAGPQQ